MIPHTTLQSNLGPIKAVSSANLTRCLSGWELVQLLVIAAKGGPTPNECFWNEMLDQEYVIIN